MEWHLLILYLIEFVVFIVSSIGWSTNKAGSKIDIAGIYKIASFMCQDAYYWRCFVWFCVLKNRYRKSMVFGVRKRLL
ncbi:hypothetical protein BTO00_20005 [Vibrio campbellii]|nr:hypothetical protein BTO00_20005 [Vibrio campbellii]